MQEVRTSCQKLSEEMRLGSAVWNENPGSYQWHIIIGYPEGRRSSRMCHQQQKS
jgi:hypothetical protein